MSIKSNIVAHINSDLATPLDVTIGKKTDAASTTVNTTNPLISYVKGTVNTTNTLNTNLNATTTTINTINTNTARGVIKSIQRGTNDGGGNSGVDIIININSVTPAKCFVLLNSSRIWYQSTTALSSYLPMLVSLTSTVLTISASTNNGTTNASPFSWQVIEFY